MKTNIKELKTKTKKLFGKYSSLINICIKDRNSFNDNEEFTGYAVKVNNETYSNYLTEEEVLSTVYCLAEGFKLGLKAAVNERN